MSNGRQLRMVGIPALFVACAAVMLLGHRSLAMAAFADVLELLLLVAFTATMFWNASLHPRARAFWLLFGIGSLLWSINQWFWVYYEVMLRRDVPNPFVGDIILFFHVVPMMAAVALRPHRTRTQRKLSLDGINFVMLLLWWLFLYAFIVVPNEYVVLNGAIYSPNYDMLYLMENLVLVFMLGMVASATSGNWRRVYWNLFLGFAVYTLGSEAINAAIGRERYYSGSLYDLSLLVAMAWLAGTGWMAARMHLEEEPEHGALLARLTRLAHRFSSL